MSWVAHAWEGLAGEAGPGVDWCFLTGVLLGETLRVPTWTLSWVRSRQDIAWIQLLLPWTMRGLDSQRSAGLLGENRLDKHSSEHQQYVLADHTPHK